MSDNILKGIIQLEAKGVSQTTSQVASAVGKMEQGLKKIPNASNQASQSLTNLSRVAQDAPYGFIGIANNINPLLESFQRLKGTTGSTGGALKALGKELGGAGGLGLAVGVASSLLVVFGDKLFGAGKAAEKAKSASDALKESINSVFSGVAKEATEVGSFVAILKSETETRERKLSAIKELQRIQPGVFANLKLEGSAVIGLENAYTSYLANLKNVIAAKIIQAKLEQKITELLTKQGATLTESEKFKERLKNITIDASIKEGKGAGGIKGLISKALIEDRVESKRQLDLIESDIKGLFDDLDKFSKQIKVPDLKQVKIKPNKIDFDFSVSKDNIKKLDVVTVKEITLSIQNVFLGGSNVQKIITEKVYDFINAGIAKNVKPLKLQLSEVFIANNNAIAKIRSQAEALAEAFNDAFQNAFTSGFESIGESIGAALSGKNIGSGLLGVMSTLLSSLGKALIKYGIIKSGIDKIFGPTGFIIPGGVAIGLGVAAIAAAAAFKNFGGARALGGPVTGGKSYLVGERGPEIFNPGSNGTIIPNNRINSFGGSGGMSIQVTGEFVQRGSNLVAVIAQTNRSQNRLR